MRRIRMEITVSGLCLIWVREPTDSTWRAEGLRGPRTGRDVEVMMVACQGCETPHQPSLVYRGRDHLAVASGTPLAPSPSGEELVVESLAGCEVYFDAASAGPRQASRLMFDRSGASLEDLVTNPANDRFLDWILQAEASGLRDINPTLATARIRMPRGRWEAAHLFRNREVAHLPPIPWRLGPGHEVPALAPEARLIVERLPTSPTLWIRRRGETKAKSISLTPGTDDTIRLALVNHPTSVSTTGSHIPMYRSLSTRKDELRIIEPEKIDDVATLNSECGTLVAFGPALFEPDLPAPIERPALSIPNHLTRIRAPQVWRRGFAGNRGARVAIFDTGIDASAGAARASLEGRVERGWLLSPSDPFDDDGHGTLMASIVAGRHLPQHLAIGVIRKGKVLNFKVATRRPFSAGMIDEDHLMAAVDALLEKHNRRRIPVALFAFDRVWDRFGQKAIRAFFRLAQRNILAVVAAGTVRIQKPHPAFLTHHERLNNILVVGSTDVQGNYRGAIKEPKYVDIAAPGFNIPAIGPAVDNPVSGSSPAAAIVAGAAALLRASEPELSAAQAKDRILRAACQRPELEDAVAGGRFLDLPRIFFDADCPEG